MAIRGKKCYAIAIALVTFLLPLVTYFLLLVFIDPVVGDQNAIHSTVSCLVLFIIVNNLALISYVYLACVVTDKSLKKLRINILFAVLFTVSFHLIVLHLRNRQSSSIAQYLFGFRLPTETYLFALYICLSRGRYFLHSLVIVSSDRLFEQWSEEHIKVRKLSSQSWNAFTLCHCLLYLLPVVEFFTEVVLYPGLKHSTVVWLGSSNDHSSALKEIFTWICVDHVEVGGGFTLLGVPIYLTFALLHLVLFIALRNKSASNWFIVLTILEGGLVLSVQILLLNPISFFVTFFVWFYIKPIKKIASMEDVVTLEELMLNGSHKEGGWANDSSKKGILSFSSSSSTSASSNSKKFSSSNSHSQYGNFRYLPFDA